MRIYLEGEKDSNIFHFYKEQESWVLERENERVSIYFREVSGRKFYSTDHLKWFLISDSVSCIEKVSVINQEYEIFKGFKPSGKGGADFGNLITQMPGKIVKLAVKETDKVKAGDTLVILEAMKMENEIKAAVDATVKSIHVKEGDSVETGCLMIELETQEK